MAYLENSYRGSGLPGASSDPALLPSTDANSVSRLLAQCPAFSETPLHNANDLAEQIGISSLSVKDERHRMGLGSFKALGAAYAIAHAAAELDPTDWSTALNGHTFVAASAGNHGLSVAAGAKIFGARAVIYLSETVPEAFANRLRAKGADVVRFGPTYEDSMAEAEAAAAREGWQLLSDSSWPGYTEWPRRVMEGYLQMAAEAADQIAQTPTHILLQAGVGGLAAAVAAYARHVWGDTPQIIVVEPDAAPALFESIKSGALVTSSGPVSCMGRLDCKTPSMVALAGLARGADAFVTISEADVLGAMDNLAAHGFETTPSGGAALAALIGGLPGIGSDAHVLCFLSEGPEDA